MDAEITAPVVFLVGPDGTGIGTVSRVDALLRAREAGCRLIEVAPRAQPPVCRMVPSDEFDRRSRLECGPPRSRPYREIRTIRFPTGVSETDFRLKVGHGRAFLEQGGALEIAVTGEQDASRPLLERILAELEPSGLPDGEPKRGDGDVSILVVPRRQKASRADESP